MENHENSISGIMMLSNNSAEAVTILTALLSIHYPSDLQITILQKLHQCSIKGDAIVSFYTMCCRRFDVMLYICQELSDEVLIKAISNLYDNCNPIRIKMKEYYAKSY